MELSGLKKAGVRDRRVLLGTEQGSKRPGFVIAQGCDSAVRK